MSGLVKRGFGFAFGFPGKWTAPPTVTPTPTPSAPLNTLTLTSNQVPEGSAAGYVVGTILGRSFGSAVTVANDAGGRFTVSAGQLVTTGVDINWEDDPTLFVTLREDLGADFKLSIVQIDVVNVLEVVLTDLTGTFQLPENAVAGAVAGVIVGRTVGSSISLLDDAGGRVAYVNGNIVRGATPLDYEAGSTWGFIVRETHPDAATPHDTTLSLAVTNVFEQPTLGPLQFSATSFVSGVPSSGSILGATPGSTITALGLPPGLAINSATRTWGWTGTGSGSGSFTLTETLSDSPNSGRTSTVSYSISATSSSTIAQTSSAGSAPFTFDFNDPIHGTGITLYWEVTNTTSPTYDANGFFTTTVIASGIDFVSGEDYANLDDALTDFFSWPGAGSIHVAPCVENDSGAFTGPDGATYDRFPFSNTLSDTITASVAKFVPTNGAKKNVSVTLSNSNLTASCLINVGANNCVAATFAAINTKFTTEITIVSNNTSGVSGFGFYDGSNPSFATTVSPLPGSSGGPNGCHFGWLVGGNNVALSRNGASGGSNNFALPTGITFAAGDILHLEVDTVAHTILVKFWDASTSTPYTLGSVITLTSQIPSQWVAFAKVSKGGAGGNDSLTWNAGGSAYAITPATGFNNKYA
jgi:hypothetical protein